MGTHDTFICFSSNDEGTAREVVDFLEARGLKCWISSRDVGPGQNYQEAIVEAIAASKVFVFLFSGSSSKSDEIKKELSLAGSRGLAVIPLRLNAIVPTGALSYELATRQWIDIFPDRDAALERVATAAKEGLRPRVDRPAGASTGPALRSQAGAPARRRDRLLGGIARIPRAHPRVGALAIVFAVAVAAALAALLPRPWTRVAENPTKAAANFARIAPADAATALVGLVKIVGATVRSDTCAAQACLASAGDRSTINMTPPNPPVNAIELPAPTREATGVAPANQGGRTWGVAADRPTTHTASADASQPTIEPPAPAREAANDNPANQVGRMPNAAADAPGMSRVAAALLPLPRLRSDTADPAALPVAPEAGATGNAGAERATDGEPRRRAGRRAYRARYGRAWSGRHRFRFPF
jgi:TIR domain-containing protein